MAQISLTKLTFINNSALAFGVMVTTKIEGATAEREIFGLVMFLKTILQCATEVMC